MLCENQDTAEEKLVGGLFAYQKSLNASLTSLDTLLESASLRCLKSRQLPLHLLSLEIHNGRT